MVLLIGLAVFVIAHLRGEPETRSHHQNHYIKTGSPDAIAAMRQFSEALLCSTCAPEEGDTRTGTLQ